MSLDDHGSLFLGFDQLGAFVNSDDNVLHFGSHVVDDFTLFDTPKVSAPAQSPVPSPVGTSGPQPSLTPLHPSSHSPLVSDALLGSTSGPGAFDGFPHDSLFPEVQIDSGASYPCDEYDFAAAE